MPVVTVPGDAAVAGVAMLAGLGAGPNIGHYPTLVTRRNGILKKCGVKNSLHRLLAENYPHYKTFFSDLTRNSALAFYEAYPAPYYLENETVETLAEFLQISFKGAISRNKG